MKVCFHYIYLYIVFKLLLPILLGEEKDGEQPEENPFDIDQMKDQTVPEENLELPPSPKEQQNDETQGFSSDDEDVTQKDDNDKNENSNEDPQNQEEQTGQDNAEPTNPEEESAMENDVNESALDENPSNQENVEAMEVDDVTGTDKVTLLSFVSLTQLQG